MANLPSTYLLAFPLFLLNPACFAVRGSYVNKAAPDAPTRLSSRDFYMAGQARRYEETLDHNRLYSSDFFEGDIAGISAHSIHSFIQNSNMEYADTGGSGLVLYSATKNRYNLWPNGEIPYEISGQYTAQSRALLAAGIKDFQKTTCVKFVPKSRQSDYVYIKPDGGCYSHVGRTGGRQTLSLDDGCFQHGTVVHEMMHTAGFFHEQNRNDRDQFIEVWHVGRECE